MVEAHFTACLPEFPALRCVNTDGYMITFFAQDGETWMGRVDGNWCDIVALMRRLNDGSVKSFGAYHVSDQMGELFVPYTDKAEVFA